MRSANHAHTTGTTSTSTARRLPGGAPDLATVNALVLAGSAAQTWTRVSQLHLILQALYHASRNAHQISKPEMEAAFELADDVRDDVGTVMTNLGWIDEELAL
ncbi:MAG TPA: hypothetical protein VHL31_11505 [Geminicoccus sp.]|jgi:hypothetical protein|uniref:hypothetical protein n=1 Tax=Geminicoccus sp. TaxID=2024832 RepID=UPI002E33E09F|nr:hypothetical protein [Geminicoccus sp.]HEX2526905.1 hypothetical protein [Geminicoccus sp.]